MRQSPTSSGGVSRTAHSHIGQLIGQLGQSALMWRSFHTSGPSALRSSNAAAPLPPLPPSSSASSSSSTATSLYVPSTGGSLASFRTPSSLRATVRLSPSCQVVCSYPYSVAHCSSHSLGNKLLHFLLWRKFLRCH